MGDLKVFRVRSGRATEIPGTSVAVERDLQSLIEASMEAMLGIRFLATKYQTGRHRGRVDSLGLDESRAPVVIEYKRSRDQNVINQALSYLVWLRDHHHEFERLVSDRLGAEAAGAVDWSNPRVVCVAGEFTYHDTVAVEAIGRRIPGLLPGLRRRAHTAADRFRRRRACLPCPGTDRSERGGDGAGGQRAAAAAGGGLRRR
ncbi:hypothetical protein [Streptomyces qinglanensis]|uniref:hypothetical protein n=1 Tax=Streptomyces qinglanensis TaxID=943816 RepID=UPI003D729776